MSGPALDLGQEGELLILTAAPAEARAVALAFDAAPPHDDFVPAPLGLGAQLVRTGVGKVNAAIAAARFVDPSRHRAVLNVGVCGSLPRLDNGPDLTLAQTVIARVSVYADEGISTPTGWQDMAAAGFPPGGGGVRPFEGMSIPGNVQLIHAAHAALGPTAAIGPIATVSTCSGSDALAREIARRTGAIAEAMEGAAIAHALARLHGFDLAFLELRTVSNTTGDRDKQTWNLRGALDALTAALRALSRR